MTKKRPTRLIEDRTGRYYQVPIGDHAIYGYASIDAADMEWLLAKYGNKSFFRSNHHICIKWLRLKRNVARLLLNAKDIEYVVYADKNTKNLRRSNISLKVRPSSAAHARDKTTERTKRPKGYIDPIEAGLVEEPLQTTRKLPKKAA